jgi:hypothetical protein
VGDKVGEKIGDKEKVYRKDNIKKTEINIKERRCFNEKI